MATTHMLKRSYDGYCVGVGIEHPGIIIRYALRSVPSAENDKDLIKQFQEHIHSYKRALAKYGIKEKPGKILTVDVRPADR